MALHFAKKLAGDQKLVVSGDNNEQIEVFGMVDGNKVRSVSFPCSKKDKMSQMKLSGTDPSILLYVVNPECKGMGDDLGLSIAMSLNWRRKADSRLSFIF
mmetsp:Transcript_25677/g.41386  ORF Transcript_25677/g.41386 Transcript_25677/m.41386 type:complete len:100 (+) Transcript_25677:317-616(+)